MAAERVHTGGWPPDRHEAARKHDIARGQRSPGLNRNDRVLRGGQDFSGTRNVCCEDQRLDDLRVELGARAPAKFFPTPSAPFDKPPVPASNVSPIRFVATS